MAGFASQLGSQEWAARRAAASAVAATAPADRSPDVLDAVIREVSRLQARPDLGAAEVPAGHRPEEAWEYYADLIDVARGSRDPAVVAVLAKGVGLGHAVAEDLAAFGDAAVPPLLETANRSEDTNLAESALYALQRMLERDTASTATRATMSLIAGQFLRGREDSSVALRAIAVVVLLQDRSFLPELTYTARATSSRQLRMTLTDPDTYFAVRDAAADAVTKIR